MKTYYEKEKEKKINRGLKLEIRNQVRRWRMKIMLKIDCKIGLRDMRILGRKMDDILAFLGLFHVIFYLFLVMDFNLTNLIFSAILEPNLLTNYL